MLIGFCRLKNGMSDQVWDEVYDHGSRHGVTAIQFAGLQQLADAQITKFNLIQHLSWLKYMQEME